MSGWSVSGAKYLVVIKLQWVFFFSTNLPPHTFSVFFHMVHVAHLLHFLSCVFFSCLFVFFSVVYLLLPVLSLDCPFRLARRVSLVVTYQREKYDYIETFKNERKVK